MKTELDSAWGRDRTVTIEDDIDGVHEHMTMKVTFRMSDHDVCPDPETDTVTMRFGLLREELKRLARSL